MGVDEIALVEIENLSYAYPESGDVALDGVDLRVEPGEFVLLTGPSGCGKSTLLRAIAALVPHFYGGRFDGKVLAAGRDTKSTKPAELCGTLGFVFQDPESQMVSTGVEAEVAFGLENLGLAPSAITRRVEETLVSMGISELRCAEVGELSGGQLQKVALASVLAMQPELLLLDEPTSQLDPVAAESLLGALRRVNEETGTTVIMAEHRLDRCYHWADRVIVMESGGIVCDDEPRAVARWAIDSGRPFAPPIAQALEARGNGDLPLTVKEGRALLGRVTDTAGGDHVLPPSPARDEHGDVAVRVRGLHYVYPNGTEALRGCDLSIATGEFVALMGENGAGKSTLVKHFNGLIQPQRGIVEVFGVSTKGVATEDLARQCALLGQNPNDYLFSDTLREELEFTLKNLVPPDTASVDLATAARDDVIDRTLRLFGLESHATDDPRSLSAGERQRAALASVLVAEPGIIVLDEPTRGMDYLNKQELGGLLRRLQSDGGAIVVVTHDVEFAAAFSDRVVLMGRGRVIADGPKHEVMDGALFLAPQVNKLMRGFVPGVLTVEEALGVLGTVTMEEVDRQ